MKTSILPCLCLLLFFTAANSQVGIGTVTPNAGSMLHVDVGANISKGVLITGTYNNASATVPDLGQGSRFMFYPGKSALRAGFAYQNGWDNVNVGTYSVAFGLATVANGAAGFATGNFTQASGLMSFAAGNASVASGDVSTALGQQTFAHGFGSTTLGVRNIARGFSSTVIGIYNDSILTSTVLDETSPTNPLFIIGNGSTANSRSNAMVVLKSGSVGIGTNTPHANALLHVYSGANYSKGFVASGDYDFDASIPNLGAGYRMSYFPGKNAFRVGSVSGNHWDNTNVGRHSVAIGTNTIASDDNAIAIGYQTRATGESAIAFGYNSEARGQISATVGAFNMAGGEISTAIGRSLVAKGYSSTVVGLYNDSILLTDQTTITSSTPLFMVGNGDAGNRSNAMVVLKNGNVGIGTNTPGANLSISHATNATLQLQESGVDKAFVQLSGDNLRMGTYSANSTGNVTFRLNGADRFIILPNGNATLTGTLTQNSDARFKQDIAPIDNALDKVMQLNGYEYYWKPELQRDSALQIGLIAQNVEKILPQLVATDQNGIKSVAYQNMVPVLIEAIKMQQQQIQKLETKIKELASVAK